MVRDRMGVHARLHAEGDEMTGTQSPPATASESKLIRIAIWVAIGALIAAALVCVVWVLIGSQNGLIGRAFLTILLLAAFAGVALMDAHLAQRRPAWFALTSMAVWVVILLIGSILIWMPDRQFGFGIGASRFMSFLLVVLILQLAVLDVRLYVKAYERYRTTFTTVVTAVTLGLVAILSFMLVFALTFGEFIRFSDFYWRVVVALAILAAVGTALLPLVNALFAPKRPRPAVAASAASAAPAALLPWPTYADGATPLPVLPDGTPDWNAYYTGHPTAVWSEQQQWDAQAAPAWSGPQQVEQTWPAPPAPPEWAPESEWSEAVDSDEPVESEAQGGFAPWTASEAVEVDAEPDAETVVVESEAYVQPTEPEADVAEALSAEAVEAEDEAVNIEADAEVEELADAEDEEPAEAEIAVDFESDAEASEYQDDAEKPDAGPSGAVPNGYEGFPPPPPLPPRP